MKKIRFIRLLLAAMLFAILIYGTANASESYVVKKGDNLWAIAQKTWGFGKMYKIIADENRIKNPGKIYPGQKLVIPEVDNIEVRATNRAPFGAKAVMGSEKILETIEKTNYSEGMKECLRRSVIDADPIVSEAKVGEKFNYYTDKYGLYGPNNYVIAADTQVARWHRECETIWMKIICDQIVADTCGNWMPRCVEEPKPPPEIKKSEEPPVTITQEPGLPPAETMEPPIYEVPEVSAPPTEEEKYVKWEGRVEAFVGTGKVWDKNSHSKWNYADVTVYPFSWETEEGRDYLGFGGIYNRWYGKVTEGRFSGKKELLKPLKYKSFDYEDNWDYSVEGSFGQYRNKYSSFDGKVENHEKYNLYGGGLNYNNYARQEAGENLFPETQIWTFLYGTANRSVKTTFEGRPIENTDKRINIMLDVGVRQFIYNFESIPIRTYAQVEFFGEIPRSKFLNLGLGLSDKWKIFFAEAGMQIDLSRGNLLHLADLGIDVGEAKNVAIKTYRRSKVVSKIESQYGIKVERDGNGTIIINDSKNQEVIKNKEKNEKVEVNYNDPSGISPIQTEL